MCKSPIEWSEKKPPGELVRYSHVLGDTPFGQYKITWKGWKDSPSFVVEGPSQEWIDCCATLEEAKQKVLEDCREKVAKWLALDNDFNTGEGRYGRALPRLP